MLYRAAYISHWNSFETTKLVTLQQSAIIYNLNSCKQPDMFSPSNELAGKTVFVTGGLGFLGSVVVEQLLRLTEVRGARNARTAMATAYAPAPAQCAAAGCRMKLLNLATH
jgi:hypothetical protein